MTEVEVIMTNEQILDKIGKRLETLVQYKIERNPEEYQKQWCDYGYINTGVGFRSCGGEWEYDEIQAKEDIINDCEWTEDEEICELINELLWRV